MTQEQASWFAETFTRLVDNVGEAVLGKPEVVRLVLTSLLAEGHVLLEDAPGTGKTLLARAVAGEAGRDHEVVEGGRGAEGRVLIQRIDIVEARVGRDDLQAA